MLSLKVKKLVRFFFKNYTSRSKTINSDIGFDFYAYSFQFIFYRSFIQSLLRKKNASVIVVATKKGMRKLGVSFKVSEKDNKVVFVTKRWVGGFLTNGIYSVKKPSAIIVVGYGEHEAAVNEANREGIPVICFCSITDIEIYGLTSQKDKIFILCNTDCVKIVWSYLYIFFK